MTLDMAREHGQADVGALIRDCGLNSVFGFESGSRFEGGLVTKKPKQE